MKASDVPDGYNVLKCGTYTILVDKTLHIDAVSTPGATMIKVPEKE